MASTQVLAARAQKLQDEVVEVLGLEVEDIGPYASPMRRPFQSEVRINALLLALAQRIANQEQRIAELENQLKPKAAPRKKKGTEDLSEP